MGNYVILIFMKQDTSKVLKHYTKLHAKNPRTRIFAPLADLLRRQGDADKALSICQKGVRNFPEWPLGYVTLGMIFMDLKKQNLACQALERAIQLKPDTLLAHKLLGQIQLQQKNPSKSLKAWEMVLYLDPNNQQARRIVQKLKAAGGKVEDETGFTFKKLEEIPPHLDPTPPLETSPPPIHPLPAHSSGQKKEQFESRLSIIKTMIYKKEFQKAIAALIEMKNIYSSHHTMLQQIKELEEELSTEQNKTRPEGTQPLPPGGDNEQRVVQKQIQTLSYLLERVKGRIFEEGYKQ